MKKNKRRVVTRVGSRPVVPGIGWYSPEGYVRLRETFTDKNNLHETWAQWEAKATETLEFLRSQGIPARKIAIDVDEMIGWCHSQHKPLNGTSRAEFIALKCRAQGTAEAKNE